jgi:putative ABC transport system permease protein
MSVKLLIQSLVMLRLGLASLTERFWSSLVIVISMACVVGVLLAMLSATAGLLHAYQTGGSPERAIVLSRDVPSEYGTSLSRNDIATILNAPGIAHGPDGRPAADAEILFWVPPAEGYTISSPLLLGVGPAGLSLRPELAIVSGRVFRSGQRELIVGVRAQRAFGLKVGDKVILPSGEWPIVGAFSAAGSLLEGQLVADAETVMTTSGISGFGSVVVRLENARTFDAFKNWLTTNPTLAVTAERQSDYYLRTANALSAFFTQIAYIVGTIMAIGAVFASVRIMYASVSNRTREIATLRAIGYAPLATAIAVVLEMVVLSLTGACLGAAVAWLLFNGDVRADIRSVFDLSVSPQLVALGLAWALVLAIVGGLPRGAPFGKGRAARDVISTIRDTT